MRQSCLLLALPGLCYLIHSFLVGLSDWKLVFNSHYMIRAVAIALLNIVCLFYSVCIYSAGKRIMTVEKPAHKAVAYKKHTHTHTHSRHMSNMTKFKKKKQKNKNERTGI